MLLQDAKTKALAESAEHACAQHVNFKITGLNADDTVNDYFYVSDWYDSDCTVFSYSHGEERA